MKQMDAYSKVRLISIVLVSVAILVLSIITICLKLDVKEETQVFKTVEEVRVSSIVFKEEHNFEVENQKQKAQDQEGSQSKLEPLKPKEQITKQKLKKVVNKKENYKLTKVKPNIKTQTKEQKTPITNEFEKDQKQSEEQATFDPAKNKIDEDLLVKALFRLVEKHKEYPRKARRLALEGDCQFLFVIDKGIVQASFVQREAKNSIINTSCINLGRKLQGKKVIDKLLSKKVIVPIKYSLANN